VTDSSDVTDPPSGQADPSNEPAGSFVEHRLPEHDLTSPVASPDVRRVERADTVRAEALRWVLGLFTVLIVFGGATAVAGGTVWTNARDFMQLVFAGVTGLVGIVIGYYFGRGQVP
jgi:hypothetical protein